MKNIIWISKILVCLLIVSGCQQQTDKVQQYQTNYEIIGDERDDIIGEISNTIYDSIDRNNSEATEMMIDVIDQYGETIILPRGRYHISGHAAGTVEITDKQGKELMNEVYGGSVHGITVDLNGEHAVHIDGFDEVFITPVETQITKELHAGIWEVGKDIAPGKYIASGYGLGYIQIFEHGSTPRVFEVIGGLSETKVELDLKKNQKMKIIGVSQITLDEYDQK